MKKTKTKPARPRSPAVERSIELLLSIAGQSHSASLPELTARSGFSKSTAHRLLGRLERIGVVERDGQSRFYRAGPRLRAIMRQDAGVDVRNISLPHMIKLRDVSGETLSLHFRDGDEQVVVEKCEGRHEVRRVVPLGHRQTISRGATAKALLAFLSPAEAKSLLGKRSGPSATELRTVRKQGFAVSHGEIVKDVTALTAPIFDAKGSVWGGLAISGPSYRFTRQHALRLAPALMIAAKNISAAFGYDERYPR